MGSVGGAFEPTILAPFADHVNAPFSQLKLVRFLRFVRIQRDVSSWKIIGGGEISRQILGRLGEDQIAASTSPVPDVVIVVAALSLVVGRGHA